MTLAVLFDILPPGPEVIADGHGAARQQPYQMGLGEVNAEVLVLSGNIVLATNTPLGHAPFHPFKRHFDVWTSI